MNKLVVFNENMEVLDTVTGVLSYSYELEHTTFEKNGGKTRLEGIDSLFIYVDEETDISTITKKDVMRFLVEAKIREMSSECDNHILGGFEYNGDVFAFTMKDQNNFNQQLSLLILDPEITNIVWKTENNGVKQFSREEFINICKAGETHKRSNITKFWIIKDWLLNTEFVSKAHLQAVNFAVEIIDGKPDVPVPELPVIEGTAKNIDSEGSMT